MKKKMVTIVTVALLPLVLCGCSSNITAKYDDFGETFTGTTYYDPMTYRATIDVKSDKTGAICSGNAKIYSYPMWQFKLVCSDGRMITGLVKSGTTEGKAFTNRNETITFSVAKKQSTINDAQKKYRSQIQGKPSVDNTKEPIQVIMQD